MARDEVFEALRAWHGAGRGLAIATLVEAAGSAPRPIGARLLVAEDGQMAGSVSGGCVEGAVIEQASQAIESGRARLLHYGVSDEAAWDVGLTCGGEIDVFLEPLDEPRTQRYLRVADAVASSQPAAVAIVVRGPDELLGSHLAVLADSTAGDWPLGNAADLAASLRAELGAIRPRSRLVDAGGGIAVFRHLLPSPPTVWIVGADNVAVYLARLVGEVGFHPIVVDPRERFAQQDRFPGTELRVGWPDEVMAGRVLGPRDYVVIVSNDPKIDEPALSAALAGRPAYIGAIGSRHKQEERLARLIDAGVGDERIRNLHAPIGLDLHSNEPAELALSIAAELVAVREGGSGHPMREVRPLLPAAGDADPRPLLPAGDADPRPLLPAGDADPRPLLPAAGDADPPPLLPAAGGNTAARA